MDVERFAAELPGLWQDFPDSPAPKGRRFDDVIEGIPNLAEENVLALLNLAASLLAPGESYVEVGSYYGASLIGAMRDNAGDFVAIDRFSFDVAEVRGRKLPPASRAGLQESLRRFGEERATILEGDAFELRRGRRARTPARGRLLLRRAARPRVPAARAPHGRAVARRRGAADRRRLRLGRGRAAAPRSTSPTSRASSCSSRSPARRAAGRGGGTASLSSAGAECETQAPRPGPETVHSVRSYQCEPRSAAATRGSVCREK